MKIYVFGNPLIKEDSQPLKLLPQLKNQFPEIEFVIADPNENFPPKNEKDVLILDTVKGITKPAILDLDDFEENKKTPVSPHDYDLLFHLLLLKKLRKIEKIMIIGLPSLSDRTKMASQSRFIRQLKIAINQIVSKNVSRKTIST